jgi:hypothetical protein
VHANAVFTKAFRARFPMALGTVLQLDGTPSVRNTTATSSSGWAFL